MQTLWNGADVPADNCVSTDFFLQRTLRFILDAAHVVTTIQLSSTTHGVNLFATGASVWYNINANPGPIPARTTDTYIDVTAFRAGGLLQPGGWQKCTMPLSSGGPPQISFVSESDYVQVDIVMLEEAF